MLPLLHTGGTSLDEISVWVGFALILGLLTRWIDYRRGPQPALAEHDTQQQERGEDQRRTEEDGRLQPRLDEIGHRVGIG